MMTPLKTSISILFICSAFTTTSHAEIVNGTHWLVRPGESSYSIARKLYPGDLKKREQFRLELMQANADVFRNGAGNMTVGSRLQLPAMAQTRPIASPAQPQATPSPQVVADKATPDPADSIGRVIINVGSVQAENRGSLRTLRRNSDILKGDTLKTADNSQAQIRLKDGALLSLRSNTEFQIEEYAFNGQEDGTEKSVFNLIKGGFRTITGLIGHRNKQNYNVRTSVATIGIRGTHYGLMLCTSGSCAHEGPEGLSDGLYGGVVDGSIITENDTGMHQFNNDQYFHIASSNTPPVEILLPPPVFHDRGQVQQLAQRNNDERPLPNGPANGDPSRPDKPGLDGPDGMRPDNIRGFRNPMTLMAFNTEFRPLEPLRLLPDQTTNTYTLPLPVRAPAGAGMMLAFSAQDATGRSGVASPVIVTPLGPNNIFLESLTLANGTVINNLPFAIYEEVLDLDGTLQRHEAARLRPDGSGANYVLASLGGSASYGGVNWGVWNGNYLVRENGVDLIHDQNFHFIYSPNLTTPTELANLGGLRSRLELYHATGGTFPTDINGLAGSSLPDITATLDFVNHRMLDYSVSVDNFSLLDHVAWSASATGPIAFSDLNRSFQIQGDSGSCLLGPCTGEASLLFIGDNAGAAMSSYSIFEPNGSYGVSGTALLTPYSPTTAVNDSAMLFAAEGISGSPISFASMVNSNSADNVYLNASGNAIAAIDRYIGTDSQQHYNSIIVPSYATLVEGGIDNTTITGASVYWGRWDSSTYISDAMSMEVASTHFIGSNNITTPTQLGGLIATAQADVGYIPMQYGASGTAIHAVDGLGNALTGGSVTMTADFSNHLITNYDISLLGLDASLAAPVDFADLGRNFALVGAPLCSANCASGTASVQFIGSNAEGAITSFALQNDFSPTTSATGTAIMVDNW